MEDFGENNKINFKQFIFLLAKFRRGKTKSATEFNTRENKLKFLFNVNSFQQKDHTNHLESFVYLFVKMYDRNHDMKIDRSELLEVLKMMVGGNIHDDQIATIADHTIGELVSEQRKAKNSI